MSRKSFGAIPAGEVEIVTLRSDGIEARVITLGASLQALFVPDREGRMEDVILGHDDLSGYMGHRGFFGATVGRFANRIRGGRFTIDGVDHTVPPNNGPNALHGGPEGFDRRIWSIEALEENTLTLVLTSPDGDQGFPGELSARVTYSATPGALVVEMTATTSMATVVNLTNHAFFNLGGGLDDPARLRSAMDHRLSIAADRYLPVDADGLPEGAPCAVDGTPFDFRASRPVGQAIRTGDEQLRLRKGYDHNFCLDGPAGETRLAARLEEPSAGRVMELWSDQPGVQLYAGNFLDGTLKGKGGVLPRMGDALCLEPQAWPDAPNRPDFPSALLRPAEVYRNRMELRFSTL